MAKRKRKEDINSKQSSNLEYYELVSDYLNKNSKQDRKSLKRPHRSKGGVRDEPAEMSSVNKIIPDAPEINGVTDKAIERVADKTATVVLLEVSESEEDYDDVDFEDIVPDSTSLDSPVANKDEVITIQINPKKQRKARKYVISKEERARRITVHKMHLVVMIVLGKAMNSWINNARIRHLYVLLVPNKIFANLHPSIRNKDISNDVKSRYFLDGLRHLMQLWISRYKLTSASGLFKMQWPEIESDERQSFSEGINYRQLNYSLTHFAGNRDIGAAGFVALLRSQRVRARLVFSVQPPDFTDAAPSSQPEEDLGSDEEPKRKKPKPKKLRSNLSRIPKLAAAKPQTALEKIIASRSKNVNDRNNYHLEKLLKKNSSISPYPIFWAEAWNPYSKRWIAIDPINFRIIEDIHRISKLEPPLNDERNTLRYAIAYDGSNRIKDVTRRYASKLNSKTRKKRITRDENNSKWFNDFLAELNKSTSPGVIDAMENEYFLERHKKEGMPTSIGDFRNHPVYVLESTLRSNEVLSPKEVVGYIKQKSGVSLPVYLRDNVHELKTARGWFHKGRSVKSGERAMGVKKKLTRKRISKNQDSEVEDSDEENERMYAEFQTSLYKPEPVKNGIITKNAYGNLDVYTESMIPEGACLVEGKYGKRAAELIGVDYAPAVTGFTFGYRSATKPQITGIIVASEFEEAVRLVCEHLEEVNYDMQRRMTQSRALKAWRLVFAKIRIVERLETAHGKVEVSDFEERDETEEHSESEVMRTELAEVYGGGGFLPTDLDQKDLKDHDRLRRSNALNRSLESDSNDDQLGFQFAARDENPDDHEIGAGGFIMQESVNEGEEDANKSYTEDFGNTNEAGGFLLEDASTKTQGSGLTDEFEQQTINKKRFELEDATIAAEDYVYDPENELNEHKTGDNEDQFINFKAKSKPNLPRSKKQKEDHSTEHNLLDVADQFENFLEENYPINDAKPLPTRKSELETVSSINPDKNFKRSSLRSTRSESGKSDSVNNDDDYDFEYSDSE